MSTLNPTTDRSVGYGRCSTDKQEESVPEQSAWIVNIARAMSLELPRPPFEDDGVVGDEMSRPGLDALLAYLEAEFYGGRQIGTLIVWNLERLSRGTSLRTSALLCRMADCGIVRIVTVEKVYSLEDATDLLLMNIRSDFQASGATKSRAGEVLRGMLSKARMGKWMGGPIPLGYAKGADGKLAVGSDEAVGLVKWIFTEYTSKDTSSTDLARQLQERGIRPLGRAKVWTAPVVCKILRNVTYRGHLQWGKTSLGKYQTLKGGEVRACNDKLAREQRKKRDNLKHLPVRKGDAIIVPNTHTALISVELWDAAQNRLQANAVRSGPAPINRWPLSSLLVCGACGSPAWCVSSYSKRGKERRNVVCSLHRNQGPGACSGHSCARYEEVLRRAVALIVAELGSAGRQTLRERLSLLSDKRQQEINMNITMLEKTTGALDREIASDLKRLLVVPESVVADLAAVVDEKKRRLAHDRARLNALRLDLASVVTIEDSKLDEAFALVDALPDLLADVDAEGEAKLRDALRMLVQKVTFTVQRTGAKRACRNRPMYILDSVKVTLSNGFADLIGLGLQTAEISSFHDSPVPIVLSWVA